MTASCAGANARRRGSSRSPRARLLAAVLALLAFVAGLSAPCVSTAGAAGASTAPPAPQIDGTQALLDVLTHSYKAADSTHDAADAARVRTMAFALGQQIGRWQGAAGPPRLAAAAATADELSRALSATRERLQPWPLPVTIGALVDRLREELQRAGLGSAVGERDYETIDALLTDSRTATEVGRSRDAVAYAAEAYALYATGPGVRLRATDPAMAAVVEDAFWREEHSDPGLLRALSGGADANAIERAGKRTTTSIDTVATVLGERTIGKDTVVADAAVIVFREGLEAVLILAAITASFMGERRRLRRPVLLGALAGLAATAITYALAQALIDALGDGGLRLQAITGLIAIAVLLLVTNWFFHRIYWSEWLGRFHKRRRVLERIDRTGFLSGELVGFVLLGLTSVYREGFETVLFLQNLQVSAGSRATALGIAIGLAGTLAVGFVTFKLERKLPYKKMLIATGVLIGLVLGVMVGTTVHSLQGLGWIPSTPTPFDLRQWWGQWLGVYATWESIGAQLAALSVVYGSYALARNLQHRRSARARSASVVRA
jgi:high-affinity iron transporter